jgi:hypothetical protein
MDLPKAVQSILSMLALAEVRGYDDVYSNV